KEDEFIESRLEIGEVVQLGEYYVSLTGPQDICWPSEKEEAARQALAKEYHGKGAKNESDGFKTVQLIPKDK
ncbi:MAG: hypothetical protein MN733_13775, partial [Nitrososphaera sp.]|nr:hypothetical protein [Nitrososphaera sp.]